MAGRIFAIVGPSGAGKDTLMEAARRRLPELHMVRRVITRPSEAGGEDFEGVTEAEFQRGLETGAFALWWSAHGLRYGIPLSVTERLDAGETVVFNGSRGALLQAQKVFPGLVTLNITAPADVLAERLAARGREAGEDLARRLERASHALPDGLRVRNICNDGRLEDAVEALVAALQPASLER